MKLYMQSAKNEDDSLQTNDSFEHNKSEEFKHAQFNNDKQIKQKFTEFAEKLYLKA